jgi:hypothetical protein
MLVRVFWSWITACPILVLALAVKSALCRGNEPCQAAAFRRPGHAMGDEAESTRGSVPVVEPNDMRELRIAMNPFGPQVSRADRGGTPPHRHPDRDGRSIRPSRSSDSVTACGRAGLGPPRSESL